MPFPIKQLVIPFIFVLIALALQFPFSTPEKTESIPDETPRATTTNSTQKTVESQPATTTKAIPPIAKKPVAPVKTEPTSPPQLPPEPAPAVTQSQVNLPDLNTKVRESIVNIICNTHFEPFKSVTATGVVIDGRGVILTNAHVAQYYLLKDYAGPNSIECSIRSGSPARLSHKGELLFISPKWIDKNRNNIIEENPLGTGEDDFALILITKKIDGTPVTEAFSALDTDPNDSAIDRNVEVDHIVAGYPAGFLGGPAIERELYISSAVARINEIFTFIDTTIDVISLGGNIVAQKGASGGAVVSSRSEKLIGLIVTTTDAKTTGERDMRAITLSHIDRSMRESTGKSIREYISPNLNETLNLFTRDTYPYLSGILRAVLTSKGQ